MESERFRAEVEVDCAASDGCDPLEVAEAVLLPGQPEYVTRALADRTGVPFLKPLARD